MSILVATSTVADGSMYERNNPKSHKAVANRKAYLASKGFDLHRSVRLRLHYETDDFCRYIEVDDSYAGKGMQDSNVRPADALITTTRNLALFLPVADCIGAVIYDEVKRVLALAHLGRHSLEQQGGEKIIAHLQETYGCEPQNLRIWLTPAAGKDVYKIWALEDKGMKEAAFEQLQNAGIASDQITDNAAETTSDENYFSYSEFLKGTRTSDGDHAIVAMIR